MNPKRNVLIQPSNEFDRRQERSGSSLTFWLFLLGAVAGLVSAHGVIPFGKGFEMCELAKNLAEHGSYANPFGVLPTGPTAANPPLYPVILALYIKVLRNQSLVFLAAVVGNLIANACTAALLPRVSQVFFRDARPGITASILWVASVQLMPAWDVSFTVVLLLLFILVTAGMGGGQPSWKAALRGGMIGGALFLLNPSTTLIVVPWLAYLQIASSNRRRLFGGIALLLVIVSLFALGWAVRNRLALGSFVVRTNLGSALYTSNNDCARPSLVESAQSGCYQTYNPNSSLNEAQLLRAMGEPAYDRMRTEDTKAWIRSHPSAFLQLTLARVREFWFPLLEQHPFNSVVLWTGTVLSIPGMILAMRRHARPTLYLLTIFALYPLMYYAVVSDVRYRYPVLWASMLLAGFALRQLVPRKWQPRQSNT
ncbi:MAG TPA: hypothetical protein VF392_08755 [Terracidiphilus sp.]